MTLLNYTDFVPTPAPVTSGGLQSYTDPLGDVWVAASGVNGGNWRRARDVLHCRYWRTTALTLTAGAWTNVTMNQVDFDDYALYSNSTGLFTPPINGMWLLSVVGSITATATGQWLQPAIYSNGVANFVIQGFYQASAAVGLTGGAVITRRISSSSDTHYVRIACSTALAAGLGTTGCSFEAHYLGTG